METKENRTSVSKNESCHESKRVISKCPKCLSLVLQFFTLNSYCSSVWSKYIFHKICSLWIKECEQFGLMAHLLFLSKIFPWPRIFVFLVSVHCRQGDATRSLVVNTLHNIRSPDKKFKGLKIYLIGSETVPAWMWWQGSILGRKAWQCKQSWLS